MCPSDQYEQMCKTEFAEIKAKLDQLDEAIRGNGEVGLKVRLDRLERAQAIYSRLLWLITASAVTGAVSLLWQMIKGM